MASQLLRKICSIFYHQPTKREGAHSFGTINGVFGDWATSAGEDQPPPYTDSPETKTHLQDEKHSPPLPFASPRLQICPHETLSFKGFQETVNSLAGETVDALTLSCHEHSGPSEPTAKNTTHICVSSPSLLRGFGNYASEASIDPSHTPNVVLYFHWDLGFLHSVRGQVETAAELQHFLSADDIWLCPHKQISDSDIVNAMYGFVQRPSGKEVRTSCDYCDTEIKILARREGDDDMCRVTTKRYLGMAEKADDSVWLAQCGI